MCLKPDCDYEFDEVWTDDGLLLKCSGPECGVELTETEARKECDAQNAQYEADAPAVDEVPVLQRAS